MNLYRNKTKALLITHFAIRLDQGPAAPAFLYYLRKRTKKVVYIEHPFPYAPIQYSFLTIYEDGEVKKAIRIHNIKGPSFLQFFYHFLLTHYFILRSGTSFDLCITCENLSQVAVLLYKKLGLIKKIAYNSMDYLDTRFPNPILNYIYYTFDKIACRTADVNWVGTNKQILAREKRGFELKNLARFEVLPNGYLNDQIGTEPVEEINPYQLVFIGGIFKTTGIDLAINTLPKLLKKFPKIRLVIIGKGEHEKVLQQLTEKLKLQKYVKFLGFVEKFKNATDILRSSGIGIATFAPEQNSLSYYSDPSKVRLYLACGLPVITTTVSTIGPSIKKKGAGVVISYDQEDFFKAVSKILNSKKGYGQFKQAAVSLAKIYDLNTILDKAIRNL